MAEINPKDPRNPSQAAVLLSLATRIRRLIPDHRDPEAFHVEKDAIERELRRLAYNVWPAPGR